MRAFLLISVVLFFVLSLTLAMADEIDDLATNLPGSWDLGVSVIVPMPKTATVEQLLSRFSKGGWFVGDVHITNYAVLKSKQISISPLTARARANDCTAVLIQTSHGRKIIIFTYDDWAPAPGWASRIFSYPEDIRGPIYTGDPIFNWLDYPARYVNWHLAFVEILNVTNEHRIYKVSDGEDKKLENLRNGVAVVKVIESPGAKMPATLTVSFERFYYFRPLKPGDRSLCFFSQRDGKWSAEGGFVDPVDYLLIPKYATRLQAVFKTPLSDKKTLADRKRRDDEVARRAQQQTAANHINER